MEEMQEKLTILISSESKKFVKQYARQQNKSVSKCIGDLLSCIERRTSKSSEKDVWIEKTAGSYSSGKNDILNDLFKGLKR